MLNVKLPSLINIGRLITVLLQIALLVWKLFLAARIIDLHHLYYLMHTSPEPLILFGSLLMVFSLIHLGLVVTRILLVWCEKSRKSILTVTKISVLVESGLFLGIMLAGTCFLSRNNGNVVQDPYVRNKLGEFISNSSASGWVVRNDNCLTPGLLDRCLQHLKASFDLTMFLTLAGFLLLLCLSKVEFHLTISLPEAGDEQRASDYDTVDSVELLKSFACVSWVSFILASVVTSIGVWCMRYQPAELILLDVNMTATKGIAWTLTGSLLALLSLLGLLQHQMLRRESYAHALMSVITFFALIGALVWYCDEANLDSIRLRRQERFNALYGRLDTGSEYTQALDTVQREFQCCALAAPKDYASTAMHTTRIAVPLPSSCCEKTQVTCKQELAYQRGCLASLPSLSLNYFLNIPLLLLLLFSVQLFVLLNYFTQAKMLNLGPVFTAVLGLVQTILGSLEVYQLVNLPGNEDSLLHKLTLATACLAITGGLIMLLLSAVYVIVALRASYKSRLVIVLSFVHHTMNLFQAVAVLLSIYLLTNTLLNNNSYNHSRSGPKFTAQDDIVTQALIVITYTLCTCSLAFVACSRNALAGVRVILSQ